MAFIRTDLSPVGAQGRAGVVPQVWSYTTPDTFGTVKGSGYFPITNTATPPLKNNNMLGNFRPNDWILLTASTGGTDTFTIIFINNDGSDGNPITTQTVDINAA